MISPPVSPVAVKLTEQRRESVPAATQGVVLSSPATPVAVIEETEQHIHSDPAAPLEAVITPVVSPVGVLETEQHRAPVPAVSQEAATKQSWVKIVNNRKTISSGSGRLLQ